MLIKNEAFSNLKALTQSTPNLPPGWEHIEDALVVQEGKSNTIARAFCKVFRKKSPQAIWIEWGHKIIGHKPHKTDLGKVVQPRPFFRPAIMAKRSAVRKAIRIGLQQLLAKRLRLRQTRQRRRLRRNAMATLWDLFVSNSRRQLELTSR